MPKDKSGKHHPNIQKAMAADKAEPKPKHAPPAHEMGGEPPSDGMDGGSPVHEHLKAMHAQMGGKHMHIHSDGSGMHTSHQVGDRGEVEGPHDHENLDALKQHMDQFLNEEGNEYGGGMQPHPMHGGY